ncbi:AbrB family transcriptional regulator [Actibacterium sp. D379-3]
MLITLRTLAIGAAGAALAVWLGIPAPFLTGPAFCVTLSALLGFQAPIPDRLRDGVFLLIGLNMGTAVTPEAVATAAKWPGSLTMLALSVLVIFLGGAALLRALFGMDRMSALLAATPGHLSFVMSLSAEVKADLASVSMIQTMRVLALTLLVPFIAPLLSDHPMPAMRPITHVMPLSALGALAVLAVLLGLAFQRLKVPAALLLAGMTVSAIAHGASITDGAMPRVLSIPAFVIMGALIGTRFTGISFRMVLRSLGATSVLTGFSALIALAAAMLVARVFGLPIVTALIAFAPGGLETMMAMSALLDANPAYVAAHHVFRLLFLSLILPLIVARTRARG